MKPADISELLGQTLIAIEFVGLNERSDINVNARDVSKIIFKCKSGDKYEMQRGSGYDDNEDNITLEEVIGCIGDILGYPILLSEMVTNKSDQPINDYDISYTWTFYKLATIKGSVTLRWYGCSEGYYSEEAEFFKINH